MPSDAKVASQFLLRFFLRSAGPSFVFKTYQIDTRDYIISRLLMKSRRRDDARILRVCLSYHQTLCATAYAKVYLKFQDASRHLIMLMFGMPAENIDDTHCPRASFKISQKLQQYCGAGRAGCAAGGTGKIDARHTTVS